MHCIFAVVRGGPGVLLAVRVLGSMHSLADFAMVFRVAAARNSGRDRIVIRERQQVGTEESAFEFQRVGFVVSGFVETESIDSNDGVDLDSLLAIVKRLIPRLYDRMLVVQRVIGKIGMIVKTRGADDKNGVRGTIGDERIRMLLGHVFCNQAVMLFQLVGVGRRREQDKQNLR